MITPSAKYISFNQDNSLFALLKDEEYKVFSVSTGNKVASGYFDGQTPLLIEMLYQSNICAFISEQHPHRAQLWCESVQPLPILEQKKVIAMLSYKEVVLQIRLTKELVVIVLEQKILIYLFRNLQLKETILTAPNPKGLCEIAHTAEPLICTLSSQSNTQLLLKVLNKDSSTKVLKAHRLAVQFIRVSENGLKVASVSEKGTNIRIHCIETGEQIQVLRRGGEAAVIQSMAISPCGNYLSCFSSQLTLHVFSLILTKEEEIVRSKDEAQGKQNVPSLRHEADVEVLGCSSFAKIKIKTDYKLTVAFTKDPFTIVTVSKDLSFQKYRFDPINGGHLILVDDKVLS